jgi:dipeptidyl aminopeptidase/acylaminoacyl peptidase
MNIWRVAIDERSGRVFGTPEPVTVPARSVGSLTISGDGKSLIYSESSQRFDLGRIGYNAARQTAVGSLEPLGGGHTVFNFSFSPDGAQLVYDTIGDTTENLWIMNADGSGRRRLTSDGYRNRGPQWSPEGNQISFYSDRFGHYDQWVIGADGSGLRPLTKGAKLDMQNGAWSPDGKRVLAGRFGETLELDARRQTPITKLQEAAAVHPVSGLFCSAWTPGPDGALAACDFWTNPAYEVAVYSPKDHKLERTSVKGTAAIWAPAANPAEVHRRLLFADRTGCFLYDRTTKTVVQIFSAAPNVVLDLAPSPNGKFLYVSQKIRDADLWLARLAKQLFSFSRRVQGNHACPYQRQAARLWGRHICRRHDFDTAIAESCEN